MNIAKKRPWFQIHLSTAVMMMITAGLLLYANLAMQVDRLSSHVIYTRGWPFEMWQDVFRIDERLESQLPVEEQIKVWIASYTDLTLPDPYGIRNLTIGILILVLVTILSEMVLRILEERCVVKGPRSKFRTT